MKEMEDILGINNNNLRGENEPHQRKASPAYKKYFLWNLKILKNIWNDKAGETAGADKISDYGLGKQSHNPIEKMKRNLRMELFIVFFTVGAVAVYYFIAFGSEYSIIGWVYALLVVLFCYYFFRKNKLLNEMQCTSCRVKSNLELQLKSLGAICEVLSCIRHRYHSILFIFWEIVLYYKKTNTDRQNDTLSFCNKPSMEILAGLACAAYRVNNYHLGGEPRLCE
jgi:hypothetical protein